MGAYDDDDDDDTPRAAAKARPRTMRSFLEEYANRVNPRPVEYWGFPEEPDHALLCDAFRGRTNIVMKTVTEEVRRNGKKETRSKEVTALSSVCARHAAILGDPRKYAAALDETTGVTCVHACAFNGYAPTLRALLDLGGADAYAKTTCGVDAFDIARLRKHADVLAVLADVEAARLAREAALKQAPIDEELARKRALEAEARQKKMEEQNRVEEAKRRMLEEEARRARQRAAEERAWKRLGIVPTRRTKWKGITIDIDERRGVGYFPKILREIPKSRPVGDGSGVPRTLG